MLQALCKSCNSGLLYTFVPLSLSLCCVCVGLCHTAYTLLSSSPDAPLSIDGIGPYVVYSPPMVGTIPMLVVAAATPDDNL